ncbi:hypothetical protein OV450_5046, partial [Actinobacteria bacterium OV450]
METATSLAIGQLSQYLRGLTQRLDPGTGWYGEFLRRDPEGLRACLDGAAMPPWDVVESLLGDLARIRGAEFAARETQHAARLRAAAVAAWDRLPGGVRELQTLLPAAAGQQAASEAAAHALTARLAATTDRTEADAVAAELAWTRDDAARAAARHHDLASRLSVLAPPASPAAPGRPGAPGPGQATADGSHGTRSAHAPASTAQPGGPWPNGPTVPGTGTGKGTGLGSGAG